MVTPTTYSANLKFIVEGQSGVSGLGGLLGQFGFRTGGGGKTNPFQIQEISKSSTLLADVLFDKNDSPNLAEEIITQYMLVEKWSEKNPSFIGFQFKNKKINDFDTLEIKAFKSLVSMINGPEKSPDLALQTIKFNEDNGLFTISTNSLSEDISLKLAHNTYNRLKYFYEEKTLENQRRTRDLLKTKVDSLDAVIKAKYFQAARFQDRNRDLITLEKSAQRDILLGEIQALSSALAEANKSYELADYSLKDSQPQFMLVDYSLPPLKPEENSMILNILKGILLGLFLAMAYIIIRKIYRDAMA